MQADLADDEVVKYFDDVVEGICLGFLHVPA
jgi:hypothetical protein